MPSHSPDDSLKALSAAMQTKDADLVRRVLLKEKLSGAQLDLPLPDYSFDMPAVVAAAQQNNREMVDLLLAAGASINARSTWWAGGFGVLDFSGAELTPYLLERGAFLDIHAAARLGRLDRMQELVESDAQLVHARGGDGQTPLHFAASIEVAAYLLDHGADIDARDIDHESTAAQYMLPERPEVARYLISRGAHTDILMAAALGDTELVARHLAADPASVLVSVSEKDFPKHDPRSGGIIYVYKFGWGKTPNMLARDYAHEEVARLLMQCSPGWLQLAQACGSGDEALVDDVLAKHPGLAESLPAEAMPHLVASAALNDARAVRLMLRIGWPADALGEQNQTALHWAAWHGNAELVRELLERNASVAVREGQFGGTPPEWARHGSVHRAHGSPGHYEETTSLLDAAAQQT